MKAYFDTLYYSQNPPVVDGPHNVDPTDSALSLILGVALLLV